jgi:hypothetical protein
MDITIHAFVYKFQLKDISPNTTLKELVPMFTCTKGCLKPREDRYTSIPHENYPVNKYDGNLYFEKASIQDCGHSIDTCFITKRWLSTNLFSLEQYWCNYDFLSKLADYDRKIREQCLLHSLGQRNDRKRQRRWQRELKKKWCKLFSGAIHTWNHQTIITCQREIHCNEPIYLCVQNHLIEKNHVMCSEYLVSITREVVKEETGTMPCSKPFYTRKWQHAEYPELWIHVPLQPNQKYSVLIYEEAYEDRGLRLVFNTCACVAPESVLDMRKIKALSDVIIQ